MLDKIESLLEKAYKVSSKNKKFIVKENSNSAKCTEAHFEAKGDYLIYKFDRNILRNRVRINTLFPFYVDGVSQCMADFIIFYKKPNGTIHAVICNLKSGKKSNNAQQVQAGCDFVKFINYTLMRLYPEDFEGVIFKICKVLFSSERLYPNNKNNQFGIINLISNKDLKETFVFEHKCK
jgi:hypothetical protein